MTSTSIPTHTHKGNGTPKTKSYGNTHLNIGHIHNPYATINTPIRKTTIIPPTIPQPGGPVVRDLLDFTNIPTNSELPFPNHTTNINPPLQMVTQFKLLTFRQLKDNKSIQAYKIWKSMCHLKISIHSDFPNIIHKLANGQLSIICNLTEMQSRSIYLATAKAIGESILKVMYPSQMTLGRGRELWEAIGDYYLSNSDTNLLKHETLRDELKNITKNTNETFKNYAI